MTIGPQDPLPCPCGNSCPLLGLRCRLHGSLMSFLVRKRTHSQFQVAPGLWDAIISAGLGGKSSLPVLYSPCCAPSHIRFRLSRSTSCQVTVSPMCVLSWPALRLLALERSGSDRPNYIPQEPKSSVLSEHFLEVTSLTSSGIINTLLTVALEAIARVSHGRQSSFLYLLSGSRVSCLFVLRLRGCKEC